MQAEEKKSLHSGGAGSLCRKPDPYCLEQLAPDGLRKEYAGQLLRRCEKQLLAFRDEADGSAEKGKLTELRALFARLSEDD